MCGKNEEFARGYGSVSQPQTDEPSVPPVRMSEDEMRDLFEEASQDILEATQSLGAGLIGLYRAGFRSLHDLAMQIGDPTLIGRVVLGVKNNIDIEVSIAAAYDEAFPR